MAIIKKKKKLFIIVSGCPRSGTSVCMDIHREIYGEDRLLAFKFSPDEQVIDRQKLIDEESNPQKKLLLQYLANKMPEVKKRENTKDLNPNGFFEHPFSVRGIQYHPKFKDELKSVLSEYKILKVVSQGLLKSDPMYIDRVVYMLRHPRAVAKSQERLGREFKVGAQGQHDIFKDVKIHNNDTGQKAGNVHTPEMFINVSLMGMVFFRDNPDIPVKIIQYEDLLADPKPIIASIYKFNDVKGKLSAADNIVEQALNRSKHEDIDHALWKDAEYVYEAMLKLQKLFDNGESIDDLVNETLQYMGKPTRENNKKNERWFCPRAKKQVTSYDCGRCMVDLDFRKNIKAKAEKLVLQNINHWADEPCPFECGMDVDRKTYLEVEDSIYMNFWRRDEILDIDKLRE